MQLPGPGQGGDGDGDGLRDPSSWAMGQAAPPVVATSARLVFQAGQTRQMFRVPMTGASAGAAYGFQVVITSALGALIGQGAATGTLWGAGGASSGPPAAPGMQADWVLRGQVNAVARANGNTYIGGQFDGMEWASVRVATLDASGNRRVGLPPVPGSVHAVAMHPDGSVFVGGDFTIYVSGVEIRNIAKVAPNGSWDTAFRPNPNGPVRAIEFDDTSVVYFGGSFTQLLGTTYPTTARNLAQVWSDGTCVTSVVNRFGVSHVAGSGQTAVTPEVLALKFAHSGVSGERFLIVGGRFNRAHGFSSSNPTLAANFALFDCNGGQAMPNMPQVNGPVRALAVTGQAWSAFSGVLPTRTIVIGGTFTGVQFPNVPAGVAPGENLMNLSTTNFRDHRYLAKNTGAQSLSAVNALLLDSSSRLWVGRNPNSIAGNVDPLQVYAMNNGDLTPQVFSSYLNGVVSGLARGQDRVLAGGEFSLRNTPQGAVPAGRLVAFKTNVALSLAYDANLRAAVDLPVSSLASGTDACGNLLGFVIGGSFQKLIAERTNLAALDSMGRLLPWGPRTNGVVHALLALGQTIYFGGAFSTVTGTATFPRTALAAAAAANDTVDPIDWFATITGATATVHALAHANGRVLIGGDFTQVGGSARDDVAAVFPGTGPAAVDVWNAQLWGTTGTAVRAIVVDGGTTYLGGGFSGAQSNTSPGLLAVDSPGPASSGGLQPWYPALSSGAEVVALACSGADVYLAGSFTAVGGQARTGVAAVAKSGAAVTAFAPTLSGAVCALAATQTGAVYVGGDFLTVNSTARRGLAALDSAGLVLPWDGSVLGTGAGESVRVLRLDDSLNPGVIWVGGRFTGAPASGSYHLTCLTRAWHIVTPNLPAADEDQPYGPVSVALTENVPCTWTISSAAAPWLQIDPQTGAISGQVPSGAPVQIPVLVTATEIAAPNAVATKWFVLHVIPVPPPVHLVLSGGGSILEGDAAILSPAPRLTVTLNQLFGTDVEIRIDYIDGTAVAGFEYAAVTTSLIIPAGHWGAEFPLCVFGDTEVDAAARTFSVRITSLTPNVVALGAAAEVTITILDDDPPTPRLAYVRNLRVGESATTPTNVARVVTDQPWVGWEFASDFSGETQSAWEIEVSEVSTFAALTWASGVQTGPADSVVVGSLGAPVSLQDGHVYYLRVRLWPQAPGSASPWCITSLRTNTPPPPVAVATMGPTGTTHTATPVLTWAIGPEADGDRLQFVVQLAGPASAVHAWDSRVEPFRFEYSANGTDWESFPQAGGPTGMAFARLRIPAAQPLDAGTWTWTVVVTDGLETSPASPAPGTSQLVVDPMYEIAGVVLDANGLPDIGRLVCLHTAPSGQTLGTTLTNSSGQFVFLVAQSLTIETVLCCWLDNTNTPPLGVAHAAAFVRFPGCNMVQAAGHDARIELRHHRVKLDSRGLAPLQLAALVPGAGSTPDFPFELPAANRLSLRANWQTLEILGHLELAGAGAAAGGPVELAVTAAAGPQAVFIAADGLLRLGPGATIEASDLKVEGQLLAEGGTCTVGTAALVTGTANLQSTATLKLSGATLEVDGGTLNLNETLINGLPLGGTVKVTAGSLVAHSAEFRATVLQLEAMATTPDCGQLQFTSSVANRQITWSIEAPEPVRMRQIQFDGSSQYNVFATNSASALCLEACGGNGAGETHDFDPGEGASGDIVSWTLDRVEALSGYFGDQRVLLTWSAQGQSGAPFEVEIYGCDQPAGTFALVATTSNDFYVESGLTNAQPRYYFVRIVAAWAVSQDSEVLEVTPQAAALEIGEPLSMNESGLTPGIVLASHGHFKASTSVTCASAGVTISQNSIEVISGNLILFEVETTQAALGQVVLQVCTPDVWVEHGATPWSETLQFQAEVAPPAVPNTPIIQFVQTGGAIGPDALTDGPFFVAVDFDRNGGGPIDPASFEFITDRDILVAGQTVAAGTDLAHSPFVVWGTPTTSGATWQVDQIATTTRPDEEFIPAGEIIFSARITNEYGIRTQWKHLRVYIQGGDADQARISGTLLQGVPNQVLTIMGTDLSGCDYVWFPDDPSHITVNSVQVVQNGGKTALDVNVSCDDNAFVGNFTFKVGVQATHTPFVTGRYTLENDLNPGAYDTNYPGLRATTAAANVILHNGEFFWNAVDIAAKGNNFPIVWDRTYRSGKSEVNSRLGRGWFGTYLQFIVMDPSNYYSFTWFTGKGDAVRFMGASPSTNQYLFTTQPGVAAKAEWPNWLGDLTIQTDERVTYTFKRAKVLNDGKWYGWLVRVEDAYGNTHDLEYDSSGLAGR